MLWHVSFSSGEAGKLLYIRQSFAKRFDFSQSEQIYTVLQMATE